MKRRGIAVLSLLAVCALAVLAAASPAGAAGPELVANPSVETVKVGNSAQPASWSSNAWGTNTVTFNYGTSAHSGTRGLRVDITKRTTGDAKWIFDAVPVTPGTTYTFSDWYRSNVATELTAEVRSTSGALSYLWIKNVPASTTWKNVTGTITAPAGTASITVFHLIARVGWLETDDTSFRGPDVVPPTTTAAPTTTVAPTTTQATTTTAAPTTTTSTTTTTKPPATTTSTTSTTTSTTTTTKPPATTTSTTSTTTSTTVPPTTTAPPTTTTAAPPTVALSAPTAGAVLTGSVTLSATTTGSVAGVTFKVDNTTVAVEDTTAPYSVSFDSTTVANGAHTITATARPATGSPVTSTPVSVTVSNSPVTPTPGELLANPSVETAGSPATAPAAWTTNAWGTNSTTFTWATGGGHTGSRYVRTSVTSRSSGDAKWIPNAVAVTPGTTYRVTDWYRSNTTTQVLAVFTTSGGTVYQWLADPIAAANWTKYSSSFSAPAGATTVTIYHLVQSVGWLEIDDMSLTVDQPTPFSRPLVTLTFDDGWASHATQALPALNQHAMKGTFFVTTDFLNTDEYLTTAQLLALRDGGQDFGSHTLDHPHLPQLTAAQVDAQLQNSKSALAAAIGRPVDTFATPYGEYNAAVLTKIQATYGAHRTVNTGYNTKVDTDVYQLRVQNVLNTTTRAEVESWVATAQQQGSWLILVFHNIVPNADTYDSTPAMLTQYLDAIQTSGVAVATLTDALNEIRPQLS